MAFCTNCGTQLPEEAKACPNCGQAVANAEQPKQEQPAAQNAPGKAQTDFTAQYTKEDIEENKVMAVLAYLGILVLIPLLVTPAKDSPFVRFHVNQGLLLFIAGVISSALSVVCIGAILGLVCFVFMILGIVNACQGRAVELPLIGKFRLLK
ncbi:MAG: zinc ribbon domain-containing protein [Clostridia bacterium]|nr:zinc ribbon domain-containing protein [Clostridia bacterium]